MTIKQKTDLILVRKREAPHNNPLFILGAEFVVGPYAVPMYFETDLASVPVGMRNLVSRLDGIEAAIVHDFLYRTGRVSRAEADRIFLKLLKGSVPEWKRWLMWAGVRIGGSFSYKG